MKLTKITYVILLIPLLVIIILQEIRNQSVLSNSRKWDVFIDFEDGIEPNEKNLPDDLLQKYDADIHADPRQKNDCGDETIQDVELTTYGYDLNNDNIEEFIIMPQKICGNLVRGASGNGQYSIYQRGSGGWQRIGELEGNSFRISNTSVSSYRDVMVNFHISAAEGTTRIYRWVEGYYLPRATEWYNYAPPSSSELNYSFAPKPSEELVPTPTPLVIYKTIETSGNCSTPTLSFCNSKELEGKLRNSTIENAKLKAIIEEVRKQNLIYSSDLGFCRSENIRLQGQLSFCKWR